MYTPQLFFCGKINFTITHIFEFLHQYKCYSYSSVNNELIKMKERHYIGLYEKYVQLEKV